MEKVLNMRLKNKKDLEENWSLNNPILLDGELIIVDNTENEDTVGIKIGNGSDNYSSLPLFLLSQNALPTVDENDEGKIIQVVNGKWTAVVIPNAEENVF